MVCDRAWPYSRLLRCAWIRSSRACQASAIKIHRSIKSPFAHRHDDTGATDPHCCTRSSRTSECPNKGRAQARVGRDGAVGVACWIALAPQGNARRQAGSHVARRDRHPLSDTPCEAKPRVRLVPQNRAQDTTIPGSGPLCSTLGGQLQETAQPSRFGRSGGRQTEAKGLQRPRQNRRSKGSLGPQGVIDVLNPTHQPPSAQHQKVPICRQQGGWRDPDSNRGHHDFQPSRCPPFCSLPEPTSGPLSRSRRAQFRSQITCI